MEPIIETCAIGFTRLADLIYDLLNLLSALSCLMWHIVVILASPIYFLTITFYTIVMTLVSVAPRQGFRHNPFTPKHTPPTLYPVSLDSSSNESSNSSDLLITPQDPPPASPDSHSLPPAIPPHLKDCEFYYNDVDIDHVEKSPTYGFTGHPVVRLNVDGVTRVCMHEIARNFLQNLPETTTIGGSNADEPDFVEEKRAMLELRDRVYVGPVQWLVRVLIEEV